MKILVGLTNDCPTKEDMDAFVIGFPMRLFRINGRDRVTVNNEAELREWADEFYEIWAIKEA